MIRGYSTETLRSIPVVALALALLLSTVLVFTARGSSHGETYWACLFGGSLSQVGTTEPANCGRGTKISWNSEGEQGQAGANGADGIAGFERAEETHEIPAGGSSASYFNHDVACETGKIAIAGGYQASARAIEVMSSFPSENGRRWIVRARNTAAMNTQELTVFASCIDAPETPPV